jgi:TDG/mug DNA glycosylase family protein
MPRLRKSRLPDPLQSGRSDYVESFPPSIGVDCRILILGSMPGVRSLAAAQYYAHPQNLFWPMMQDVFGVKHTLPYLDRMAGLRAQGVGLWDVLQGCERRGSLDSAIERESEVPNAIAALLQQRREIRTVAFNGAKAAQAFARHITRDVPASRLRELELLALPSTSPAHASMTREEKRRLWSVLAQVLQRR